MTDADLAELDPELLIDLGSIRQKSGKVVAAWAAEADFDPARLESNPFTVEWRPRSGTQRVQEARLRHRVRVQQDEQRRGRRVGARVAAAGEPEVLARLEHRLDV